ncbi:Glutamate decarboxylase [Wickerhamomyces ciferrii]|uniref:Glutamate decarboxylase n=1 Tax=Wickerhamomyces ciferrii (strain ATCC 14091 / BCRC 22168 / CBS 111 / JCM 3599 / NBRC 0793 / NRRL Y-1031 F-60-10) TaxID=1206466 RepID=K0K883_WICCF|nr:Glutamate decarboxylase [Wickerhamomyces ciferrii]CCH41035.1 Glutamate decarboxylase [Wickerhamomyces ciferrii]
MLSKLVDPEKLEDTILSNSHYHNPNNRKDDTEFVSQNKYEIPQNGLDEETTYCLLHDDLSLDGNPTLNLASFVNTFSTLSAKELAKENLVKNLADADEYPTLIDLTTRNISILGKLWNRTDDEPIGTATTGSSEAIMLGGLALKKIWQQKRKDAGEDYYKPNIIMGSNAQVALEKFARYFDVEARLIPVSKDSNYVLDPTKIEENVDENTIGIFIILGSTYTGAFEDVEGISKILDKVEKEKGFDVPIHVDGASGAFVAPFIYPELKWDFRIPRVVSINTSGHKFGLTTAGLGWIIWRDSKHLPQELIFKLRYLGSVEESFNLNFSRPGYQSIHQYYNFLHLGFEGYKKIHHRSLKNSRILANFLEKTQYFEVVSNIHRKEGVLHFESSKQQEELDNQDNEDTYYNKGLPVVAFRFRDEFKKQYPHLPQAILSTLLRKKGWIIPNYPLPPNEDNLEILRVVVRYELTDDLLFRLIGDILKTTQALIKSSEFYQQSVEAKEDQARTKYIYELLTSIASGGEEDIDNHQKKQEHKEKDHSTFKGTC